jgi:putative DNA primase/helicase
LTTQFHFDLRGLARALNGEVGGGQVLAPGPGHGPRDRSMSVKLSATSPDGLIAHSFCGDSWQDCRDFVRQRLGLPDNDWKTRGREDRPTSKPSQQPRPQALAKPDANAERTSAALALWHASAPPRGTLAERYLASRGLELGDDVALEVLRWNPDIGAMVALFRDVRTDEPRAVSRTFLNREGVKIDRRFRGPVGGCAVKLDADEEVLGGLHIGEGIETCMAARMLGLRPTWALGSAGAIAAFPVLSGIEFLTILEEHDDASKHAVEACAARWHAAGREVIINEPVVGKDLNDSLRRGRS